MTRNAGVAPGAGSLGAGLGVGGGDAAVGSHGGTIITSARCRSRRNVLSQVGRMLRTRYRRPFSNSTAEVKSLVRCCTVQCCCPAVTHQPHGREYEDVIGGPDIVPSSRNVTKAGSGRSFITTRA